MALIDGHYSSGNLGLDTACFRLITDIEAEKIFGIPKLLFASLKNEVKMKRKISEKSLKVNITFKFFLINFSINLESL